MKRAQVSLVFTDMDLYENCIQPLKENRELSNIIIKCLTSYYYNDTVRNAIEGYSEEEIANNNSSLEEATNAINNIQATISLMGYGIDEVSNVLEGGIQDMEDMMSNDPTQTDIYKKYTEPEPNTDENIPRIANVNIEKFKEDKANQKLNKPVEHSEDYNSLKSTLDVLVTAVSGIYSSLGLANNPFSNSTLNTQATTSKSEENSKNDDLMSEMSVPTETVSYHNDFDSEDSSSNFDDNSSVFKTPDILAMPSDNVNTDVDAQSAIRGFLGSLEGGIA